MASLEVAVESLSLALDDLETQLEQQKRDFDAQATGLNADLTDIRERAEKARQLTRTAATDLDQSIRDLKALLDLTDPAS
ncbi:MAG: hypothetical protein AAFR21_08775 [Pseudomonadota bacterium]